MNSRFSWLQPLDCRWGLPSLVWPMHLVHPPSGSFRVLLVHFLYLRESKQQLTSPWQRFNDLLTCPGRSLCVQNYLPKAFPGLCSISWIQGLLSWKGLFLAQLFVLMDNLQEHPWWDGLDHSSPVESHRVSGIYLIPHLLLH